MKCMNVVRNFGSKIATGVAAASALVTLGMTQAYAALPTDTATQFQTAQSDSNELGYMVLGALIGIFALKLVRKAL